MTTTPPPTYDDLAAGPELDALIAEKVMGMYSSPGTANLSWSYPLFSTDIGAAWQVLDEMVWRVGMANIRLDMEDYGRGAGSGSGAERAVWVTIGEYTAFGPAPLAICKAALMATSARPPTRQFSLLPMRWCALCGGRV